MSISGRRRRRRRGRSVHLKLTTPDCMWTARQANYSPEKDDSDRCRMTYHSGDRRVNFTSFISAHVLSRQLQVLLWPLVDLERCRHLHRSPSAAPMLGQRLWRWPSIGAALVDCIASAGMALALPCQVWWCDLENGKGRSTAVPAFAINEQNAPACHWSTQKKPPKNSLVFSYGVGVFFLLLFWIFWSKS